MKMNRMQLMSEGNVSKALFKLGIPMVVSMLVTAIYNVVDTYFVSGLGTQQSGAVSVAFPLSLIFSGIGLTFGVGAGSYISRLLGKKQAEDAHRVASTAMFSSVIASLVVAVVLFAALTPVMNFMGAIPSIMAFAEDYARVFLISLVFSAVNVTAGNLSVAQGATNISLVAMLSGAILNMILDPIFIYAFDMGVQGAAIATLIAQVITSLMHDVSTVLAHSRLAREKRKSHSFSWTVRASTSVTRSALYFVSTSRTTMSGKCIPSKWLFTLSSIAFPQASNTLLEAK